jgi:hypothetical protein
MNAFVIQLMRQVRPVDLRCDNYLNLGFGRGLPWVSPPKSPVTGTDLAARLGAAFINGLAAAFLGGLPAAFFGGLATVFLVVRATVLFAGGFVFAPGFAFVGGFGFANTVFAPAFLATVLTRLMFRVSCLGTLAVVLVAEKIDWGLSGD